ncbi:MAG TPA: SCO family protein [Marmoricola sp.]|nr:SCO family protein [Marmoricola sp.]
MHHAARRTRRAALGGLLCVLTAALAACGAGPSNGSLATGAQSGNPQTVASGSTLDQKVPATASNAPLVDQDGRRFTLASLAGKDVVVAPFLTMCQETCPMTSANMRRAASDAGQGGDRTVFLEVSVDPARDTVARMHAYQAQYGALPTWRLATGRPAAVTAFWRALGVSLQKVPGEGPVRDWFTGKMLASSYDVQHQDLVLIIDTKGRIRWISMGRPDARGLPLPTTLKRFLNHEGRGNRSHPDAGGASVWTAKDVDRALTYVHRLDATS